MNSVQQTNILGNLNSSLIGMRGDLNHLPQNHGNRSFLQEAAKRLEKQIAKVEAQKVEKVSQSTAAMRRAHEIHEQASNHWNIEKSTIHFGECLRLAWWEVKVGGQVVFTSRQAPEAPEKVEEVEEVEEIDKVDDAEEVDEKLMDALGDYFKDTASMWKGKNRQRVWYREGVRHYRSIYHMILKGVPGGFVRGTEQWAKETNAMAKLNGLLRLAAVIEIATGLKPESHLDRISEEQIDEKIEEILSHQTMVW